MFQHCVYPCAHVWRRLLATCFALVVLNGLDHSLSFATFFDLGSFFGSDSPSVKIRVVDTAGPIEVEDDFTGTGSNGLPTIKIKEKLRQPTSGGTEVNLWSDVEIEICIDTESDGSPIDDIIDDINDIIDNFFGSWGRTSSQSSYNHNYPDEPEEEEDPWENGVDIGVDKFVKNKAGVLFSNYRMVLGTGVGDGDDGFVPSTPSDGLYFLSTPMPKETTDYFQDPPLADGPYSDYLHWTSDGVNDTGLNHYQQAAFWFGVHIPREMFVEEENECCDGLTARFTIRQHTGVPEPTSLVLLWVGVLAISLTRRNLSVGGVS